MLIPQPRELFKILLCLRLSVWAVRQLSLRCRERRRGPSDSEPGTTRCTRASGQPRRKTRRPLREHNSTSRSTSGSSANCATVPPGAPNATLQTPDLQPQRHNDPLDRCRTRVIRCFRHVEQKPASAHAKHDSAGRDQRQHHDAVSKRRGQARSRKQQRYRDRARRSAFCRNTAALVGRCLRSLL